MRYVETRGINYFVPAKGAGREGLRTLWGDCHTADGIGGVGTLST